MPTKKMNVPTAFVGLTVALMLTACDSGRSGNQNTGAQSPGGNSPPPAQCTPSNVAAFNEFANWTDSSSSPDAYSRMRAIQVACESPGMADLSTDCAVTVDSDGAHQTMVIEAGKLKATCSMVNELLEAWEKQRAQEREAERRRNSA